MNAICPNGHQNSDDSLFCNTCGLRTENGEGARGNVSAGVPALQAAHPIAQPEPTQTFAKRPSRRPKIVIFVVSVVGVLAIASALTLGILWSNASADLVSSQRQLHDAQSKLSASQSARDTLERNARYTACAKFYAGFAMGKGLDTDTAAHYALDSCAAESAWTFDIDTAPKG